MNIRTFTISTIASLAMAAVGTFTMLSTATAQESPFSNASFHGTYVTYQIGAEPTAPYPNYVRMATEYFDGQGTVWYNFVVVNRIGDPDADGNPTRDARSTLSDPPRNTSTNPYQVGPMGTILWGDQYDGVITQTEMIGGVLTAVEAIVVRREGQSLLGGAASVWIHTRIADGNLLPPPPPPAQ